MNRNEKARDLVNKARGYWASISLRIADKAQEARLVERAQESRLLEQARQTRLVERVRNARIPDRARAAQQQVRQLADTARRLRSGKQASSEWVDAQVKQEMEATEEQRSHEGEAQKNADG